MKKLTWVVFSFIFALHSSQAGDWSDAANRDTAWSYATGAGAINWIGTEAQLAQFAWQINQGNDSHETVTIITNSLDLSGHEWTPIGNGQTAFNGKLRAESGVTITGMSITNTTLDSAGLVGNLFGSVDGVVLLDVDIHSSGNVGGIAGLSYGNIRNCSVYGEIQGTGASVGGIVGKTVDYYWGAQVIVNCASHATLSGDGYVGGIVGDCSGTLENVANYGVVHSSGTASGGIAGRLYELGEINNGVNIGTVTGTGYIGELVGSAADVWWGGVYNCYWPSMAVNAVCGNGSGNISISNCSSFDDASGTLQSPVNAGSATGVTDLLAALNAWVDNRAKAAFDDSSSYASYQRYLGWAPGSESHYPYLKTRFSNWADFEKRDVSWEPDLVPGAINEVATAGELAQFAWFVNQGEDFAGTTVLINNNIDLSTCLWTPAGNTGEGTLFNGKLLVAPSMTISGLVVDDTGDDAGLFGWIGEDARVDGITLASVSVSAGNRVGGLAGVNEGTLMNCSVAGSVAGRGCAGGLVGENRAGGRLVNSVNRATVASGNTAGGIVGENAAGGVLANTLNYGTVTGGANQSGALAGINAGGVTNGYWRSNTASAGIGTDNQGHVSDCSPALSPTETLTTAVNVGAVSGITDLLAALNTWRNAENANIPDKVQQYHKWASISGYSALAVPNWADEENRDTTWTPDFQAGATNIITTAEQLAQFAWWMREGNDFTNTVTIIGGMIDLSACVWTPAGNTSYYFDGTLTATPTTLINGLTIATYTDFGDQQLGHTAGLLARIGRPGSIDSINLTNVLIRVDISRPVGTIAGYNLGTVNGCVVHGIINGRFKTGGIVGDNNYGLISNCTMSKSVFGISDEIGGITGVGGNVISCTNYATVATGQGNVGGISGGSSKINDCINYGTIIGAQNTTGGITTGGSAGSAVNNCINYGDVYGNQNVGGIAGAPYNSTVSGCVNYGLVTGSYNIGGITGNNNGSRISNCENHGTITGDYVGGIAGISSGDMINNINFGAIIGAGECEGGIVGRNNNPINNCVNYAPVSKASVYSGEVVGINNHTYSRNCYWYAEDEENAVPAVGSGHLLTESAFFGTAPGTFTNSVTAGIVTTNDLLTALNAWVDANADEYIYRHYYSWEIDSASGGYPRFIKREAYWEHKNNRAINWNYSLAHGATNQITSAAEFAQFAWLVNQGFDFTNTTTLVTSPIDLSGRYWTPIGHITDNHYFNGSLRTLPGVVVNGLTVYDPIHSCAGLFGWLGTAGSIDGIILENIVVHGHKQQSWGHGIGGLAGRNEGVVANCNVSGFVTGRYYIGGLVGYNYGIVANSRFSGTVSGYQYAGGIIGEINTGFIVNCVNQGSVSGESNIGGISGSNYRGTIANGINYGGIAGNTSVGGISGSSSTAIKNCVNYGVLTAVSPGGIAGGGSSTPIENCYWHEDTTPNSGGGVRSFGEAPGYFTPAVSVGTTTTTSLLEALNAWVDINIDLNALETAYYQWAIDKTTGYPHLQAMSGNWSDEELRDSSWEPALASGSTNTITTAGQLAQFAWLVNQGVDFADTRTVVAQNIYLGTYLWTPIGVSETSAFSGTFTTQPGVVINGLTINDNGSAPAGLFGYVGSDGCVDGVTLTDIHMASDGSGGGVAGQNDGMIVNCFVTGDISGDAVVGGIAGVNNGVIQNCAMHADVAAQDSVGGIAGQNAGDIANCMVNGRIEGEDVGTGGIAGASADGGVVEASYWIAGTQLNLSLAAVGEDDGATANCVAFDANGSLAEAVNFVRSDNAVQATSNLISALNVYVDAANKGNNPIRLVHWTLPNSSARLPMMGEPVMMYVALRNGDGTYYGASSIIVTERFPGLPTVTSSAGEGYVVSNAWFTADGLVVTNGSSLADVFYPDVIYAGREIPATTCTVTFDAQGGSVSPDTKVVEYDTAYGVLPTPARTGYDFGGWFTAPSGNGTEIHAASIVAVTGTQVLYAKWDIITYSITYADTKGVAHSNPSGYTISNSVTFAALPNVTGFSFTGWSPASIELGSTGNKLVTALWDVNTYTVTFDLGSHGVRTGGGALVQTVAHGTAATAPEVAANDGWWLYAWSTNFTAVTGPMSVQAQYLPLPVAFVDVVPASAKEEELVFVSGHGTGVYAVVEHRWTYDSVDEHGDAAGCPTVFAGTAAASVSLRPGTWRIALQVCDVNGGWSVADWSDIIVEPCPADLQVTRQDITLTDMDGHALWNVMPGQTVNAKIRVHNTGTEHVDDTVVVSVYEGLFPTDLTGYDTGVFTLVATGETPSIGGHSSAVLDLAWVAPEDSQTGPRPYTFVVEYAANHAVAAADSGAPLPVDERSLANNLTSAMIFVGSTEGLEELITATASASPISYLWLVQWGYPYTVSGTAHYNWLGDGYPVMGAKVSVTVGPAGSYENDPNTSTWYGVTTSPHGHYSVGGITRLPGIGEWIIVRVFDGYAYGEADATFRFPEPVIPSGPSSPNTPTLVPENLVALELQLGGTGIYDAESHIVHSAFPSNITARLRIQNASDFAIEEAFTVRFGCFPETWSCEVRVTDGMTSWEERWIEAPQEWTPSATGLFIVQAAVDYDDEIRESNEYDNTASASVIIQDQPDLRPYRIEGWSSSWIRRTDLSLTPSQPVVGDVLTVTATLYNAGPGNCTRDFNAVLLCDGTVVATQRIAADLPAFSSTAFNVTWDTAGINPGNRRIGLCMDWDDEVTEGYENNNLIETTVHFFPPHCEMRIQNVNAAPYPLVGDTSVITATIINSGGVGCDGGTATFKLHDAGGPLIGEASVPPMAWKGGGTSANLLWTPQNVGATTVSVTVACGSCNTTSLAVFSVGDPPPILRVLSEDIAHEPGKPRIGDAVRLRATVRNASATGGRTAENVLVSFAVARDAAAGYQQVGNVVHVGTLLPGQSATIDADDFFVPEHRGSHVIQVAVEDPRFPFTLGNPYNNQQATRAFGVDMPVADAGAALNGTVGELVMLNGSADEEDADWSWHFIETPAGSTALLEDPDTATPSFTPDVAGRYRVGLVVTVDDVESEASEVIVTVDTVQVSASAGTNGSITPSGTRAVPAGSTIRYTMTPDTGYRVDDVLVNGVSVGATTEYTFSTVVVPHVIEASFILDTCVVTFDPQGGTVTPATKTVTFNTQYGELPTPALTGYSFGGWFTQTAGAGNEIRATNVVAVTGTQTLYAKWAPTAYAITYANTKGATNTNPDSYTIEEAITFAALPNVTGYTFAGWNVSAIALGSTGAKTITAQWTPVTYTITYANTKGVANTNPTSYTIEDAIVFATLADVTGYTFAGWNPVSIAAGSTGNKTITAQWDANIYTLTFDAQGGTVTPSTQPVTYGAAYGELPVPVFADALFGGWWTEPNGGGTYVTNDTPVTITADQTLYANWDINSILGTTNLVWFTGGDLPWFPQSTTTYDGGTLAMQSGAITHEQSSWLAATLEGPGILSFRWGISAEANYDVLACFIDDDVVATLSSKTLNWESETLVIPPGEHTVYWMFAKDENTTIGSDAAWLDDVEFIRGIAIEFDTQGGECETTSLLLFEGESFTNLPLPMLEGYTFGGWWTEPDGSGFEITNNTPVTLDLPTVLYAHWTGNTYHVTLDPCGGIVTPGTLPINYGTPYGELPEPTFAEAVFTGWWTQPNGGTRVTSATVVDTMEDHTLYAQWEINSILGSHRLRWSTGGDNSWFAQSDAAVEGAVAMQSGAIGDNQQVWLETTVYGPGTLTFSWRVSSEGGYDQLSFDVNGTPAKFISGTKDTKWQHESFTFADGEARRLRWAYTKDTSYSEGFDSGWLDAVHWTPAFDRTQTTQVPVLHSWLDAHHADHGCDYETLAHSTGANGIPVWHSYVADLIPTDPDSKFTVMISMEGSTPRITWDPDRGSGRKYTIQGKASLTDEEWTSPTNSSTRFFRVKVEMPNQ